jgi:hypothetical protein
MIAAGLPDGGSGSDMSPILGNSQRNEHGAILARRHCDGALLVRIYANSGKRLNAELLLLYANAFASGQKPDQFA